MYSTSVDNCTECAFVDNQFGSMSSSTMPISSFNGSHSIYYSSPLSSPGFGTGTGGQFCSYPCTVSIVSTSPQSNNGFSSQPIPIASPNAHYRTISACVCGNDSPEHVSPIVYRGIPHYPLDPMSNSLLIPVGSNSFGNFGYAPPPYQFEWQPSMVPMSTPPSEFSVDATQLQSQGSSESANEGLPNTEDQEIEVKEPEDQEIEVKEPEETDTPTAATAVENSKGSTARMMPFCGFCFRNRERPAYYQSHCIKNEQGITTCPVLRNYTCPTCKATGDNAHTLSYCPEAELPADVVRKPSRRKWRNARGVVGHYFYK